VRRHEFARDKPDPDACIYVENQLLLKKYKKEINSFKKRTSVTAMIANRNFDATVNSRLNSLR
jgi:hypothetical protein